MERYRDDYSIGFDDGVRFAKTGVANLSIAKMPEGYAVRRDGMVPVLYKTSESMKWECWVAYRSDIKALKQFVEFLEKLDEAGHLGFR